MRWVVVGAGAAGCVVAARLSERPGAEVVLLEAGPDHGAAPATGDVGPYFDDPARVRVEQVVRRPGSPPEPYRQGIGLGGSSLINGSIVVGAPDDDVVHLLPTEPPWADGAVGAALLRADAHAARVRLARRDGHRVSVADAYLRPVLGRPNLIVRTGAAVSTVRLEGRRATGVVLASGEVVTADRVVLCAGAIRTPAILLRSGVDTVGVGAGLQDHPAFTITLGLRPDAVDPTAPTIAVAAVHESHQVLALNHLPGAEGLGALTVGLLRVRSRGSVTLPDPDGDPVVDLAQLTDPADVDRLTGAVLATLRTLDHPAWSPVVEGAFVDADGTPAGALGDDPARVADWITSHLGGHHHVAATCAEGVVTDGGVVRGHDDLLVCDASLFPGVPAWNPYLSVITLAERTVAGWR